jgi:transcriptional regulator with XRE-family HTH domain
MAKNELYATKALRDARRSRKLTQQEMADLLCIKLDRNVALDTYIKWEQGVRPLSTNVALVISREVGQSVKDLFGKGEYNFET